MPKGRAKLADAADHGNSFSQPNAPTTKRRKKSQNRASPGALEPIPSLPNNLAAGPMVAQNPFDDQPHCQPIPGPLPNAMPYPGPRPGMMGPYNFPPGHRPHRMLGPGPLPPPSGHPNAGKIYPNNASMIFNPSNPNAPPIYPCGVCHKEVHDNDQAILCESGCNFWFHRTCTGLSDIAFHMLTQEVYAEWVCDKCLSSKNIPLIKMKP